MSSFLRGKAQYFEPPDGVKDDHRVQKLPWRWGRMPAKVGPQCAVCHAARLRQKCYVDPPPGEQDDRRHWDCYVSIDTWGYFAQNCGMGVGQGRPRKGGAQVRGKVVEPDQ
ncbi:MAG TPA: hypothetical protein VGQ44_11395 [Gemmatimonadaceae bacterium]|jgi:hypothetical protein|nr:hypothetical protein [Gemmatimonadaceae bacterium]